MLVGRVGFRAWGDRGGFSVLTHLLRAAGVLRYQGALSTEDTAKPVGTVVLPETLLFLQFKHVSTLFFQFNR